MSQAASPASSPTFEQAGQPCSSSIPCSLSHRAGLTTSGFPGYEYTASVPSAVDVLSGRGNTEAVVVDTMPGTAFRYSSGGYVEAQQLIEDVTGKPFAEVLQQLVLSPAHMDRSTFAQPLPNNLTRDAASAHIDGKLVKGRWHVYPELAPAGLWTTPSDIARFMLAIRSAWLGESDALLKQNTAREMLNPTSPAATGSAPASAVLGTHCSSRIAVETSDSPHS